MVPMTLKIKSYETVFFRAEHSTSEAQATQEVAQLDITEEQHEEPWVPREEDDKYTGKNKSIEFSLEYLEGCSGFTVVSSFPGL